MELIYEGVNITNRIVIAGAEVHDVSGGRSDSMLLTLNRALDWYCWDPKPDDRIELRHNGWSSGEMYLAAIAPEKISSGFWLRRQRAEHGRKRTAVLKI